jgi:RNA polymerase sigma-70 factor (ECF subfamily)
MAAPGGNSAFPDTLWSVVLSARGETPRRQEALERLCRDYWGPVYAFIRRHGASDHDAEDMTQEFFARMIRQDGLAGLERSRGRFRTYLLGAVRHHVSDHLRRARAQKRGGGQTPVPLEELVAGGREPAAADAEKPDRQFDRQWALAMMERAQGRLKAECARAGQADRYEAVFGAWADEGRTAAADRLGLSENALNLTARRYRERYEAIIREEVAQTVSRASEVDDEIRHLLAALAA